MTITVPLTHLSSAKPSAAESSSRKTLNGLALAVAKAKRIVVVTGAGISCSSGIPDFRSSDGLYNLVKARYPDVVMKGRDLFDAALFRDPMSCALFYTFMAELKTQIDSARPAPVHEFLATLDLKGKLLRSYTQNIDGLESRAGLSTQEFDFSGAGTSASAVPRAKNVQLHGDIHRVRCTLCSASFPCEPEHIEQFRTGLPPDCPECIARSDARTARAARALKCGTLRPAIVLYDEPHPLGDHIGAVQTSDLAKKPDLLIVMGTSLKVHGLRSLVKAFAKAVHSSRTETSRALLHSVVFVNRTPPPPGEWAGIFDYHVQGDADSWVAHVLAEWKRVRPVDWEVQSTLEVVPSGADQPRVTGKTGTGKVRAAAGVKGKGRLVGKKAKAKSAESENTPPEENARFTIVLPKPRMRLGLAKSPGLGGRSTAGLGLRATPLGRRTVVGGVSKSPLLTPAKKTVLRIGLKRPAASPLTPRVHRQARIDAIFTKSPRPTIVRSESESSTPYPATSGHSSELDLVPSGSQAPSSQGSRSSTQDSIFSSQDSQSTAASSMGDLGEVECGVGSSQTVGPGTQSTIGPGAMEQEAHDPPEPDGLAPEPQDTIMASPRAKSLPMCTQRYLGPARKSPFRCASLGSGQLFASSSQQPEASSSSMPVFGSTSPWSSRRTSSATGRPFVRNQSLPDRPATHIPIPGRDFFVTSSGERVGLSGGDTDSEDDVPLASRVNVSITAPPNDTDSDVDVVDEPGPPRGLLFAQHNNPQGKGKGKGKEVEVGVGVETALGVEPSDDGMSLDGAVEHMSLGDPDVDVTGTDSGRERFAVVSPIKTRARRSREAASKKVAKRASRTRVLGTRSSQRLAVKASS